MAPPAHLLVEREADGLSWECFPPRVLVRRGEQLKGV